MKKKMVTKKSKRNCCDCQAKTKKRKSKRRTKRTKRTKRRIRSDGSGRERENKNVFSYKEDRFIPSSVNKTNFYSPAKSTKKSTKKSPKKSPKKKTNKIGGLFDMSRMR